MAVVLLCNDKVKSIDMNTIRVFHLIDIIDLGNYLI